MGDKIYYTVAGLPPPPTIDSPPVLITRTSVPEFFTIKTFIDRYGFAFDGVPYKQWKKVKYTDGTSVWYEWEPV